MRRLFEGIRRITEAAAVPAAQPVDERAVAGYPPPVPIERMGPGRFDQGAKEAQAEIDTARAPLDFPAPAWALAEIADLRKQLADATAAAKGRTLAQMTADMPRTEAGRVSELAAVRADRDRLEQVNDRLRDEIARLRERLAADS